MKALLRNARITPKKMNLVAGIVRGKSVTDALAKLHYTPKKAALLLTKVIHSALANAEDAFGQKKENLYLKEILVTKGVTYKRGRAISRGRYHPILKRNSHVTVEIGVLETPLKEEKEVKSAPSEVQKTAKKKESTKKSPKAVAKKTRKKTES